MSGDSSGEVFFVVGWVWEKGKPAKAGWGVGRGGKFFVVSDTRARSTGLASAGPKRGR